MAGFLEHFNRVNECDDKPVDGTGGALFSDKPKWGWSLKTLTPVGTSRCTVDSFE
jgi:hypothetical protein